MKAHLLLQTAVIAVLVCAAVCGWALQPQTEPVHVEEHRCGFDELQARTISTRVSRVTGAARELAAMTVSTAWQPLRIAVFTYDTADDSRYCTEAGQTLPNFRGDVITCELDDILTVAKAQTLRELLMPSAVRLHEERLSVQRAGGNIVVDSSIRRDPICGQFSIPASHRRTGVADADFVLYVAAAPAVGNTVAWATTCQYFADGRPSVGVVNVSPRYITADPQKVRVVAHEILHALGFSIANFRARSMVEAVTAVRGKPSIPVVTSPSVVAQAQAQYGCSAQTFMELEDVGGDGTAGSHWKRRSAKDELMAGSSGAGIYSAITIAAMEDLGYYKGNYSMAEPMMYGRNAGCGLVTDKCVVNGVSQIPEMFCASASTDMVCTSDRLGIGYCTVSTSTSALPPYFQYFSNPTLGGNDAQMDYCPYVQAYSDTNCTDASGELIGIMYGVMSRCLDTPGGIGWGRQSRAQYGLCAEVQCGDSTYGVKVSWETEFTPCTPGASLSLPSLSQFFSDGTVTCPSYESVCAIRVDSDEYEKYRRLMWGDSAARASTETAVALAVAAAVLALLVQC